MAWRSAFLIGTIQAGITVLGAFPAAANEPMHASYATYAAGLHVADVASAFVFGPWTYQMQFAYRTTGVVGFFYRGHESDSVHGTWRGQQAEPSHYNGHGVWRGEERDVELDYLHGSPVVQKLVPPNDAERETVPEALRQNTIDSLSALAQLLHIVSATGRCDTTVRTFDGRRMSEISAHTIGNEQLAKSDRSAFAGSALRCDFEGRLVAGFKHGGDRDRDSRPMHGSAWIAPVGPGGDKLPVRLTFDTRWFGQATMYLTDVGAGGDLKFTDGS